MEQCKHKFEKKNPVTGDPLQPVYECKLCGISVATNLVTGEVK